MDREKIYIHINWKTANSSTFKHKKKEVGDRSTLHYPQTQSVQISKA